MTNEERDNKINEIHTAVMIQAEKVNDHDKTLYGNGNPGIAKDVTILQERQEQCPARVANGIQRRRLGIAQIMVFLAALSLIASVAVALFK